LRRTAVIRVMLHAAGIAAAARGGADAHPGRLRLGSTRVGVELEAVFLAVFLAAAQPPSRRAVSRAAVLAGRLARYLLDHHLATGQGALTHSHLPHVHTPVHRPSTPKDAVSTRPD
jgi:hypothetical protein